jgi:hypothetical protein
LAGNTLRNSGRTILKRGLSGSALQAAENYIDLDTSKAGELRGYGKTLRKPSQSYTSSEGGSVVSESELGTCGPFSAVISPTSSFRTKWDVTFLIFITYNLMDIPFRVAFEVEVEMWGPLDIFNLLIDLFFLVDVILNFRTGFFKDGIYVTDKKEIAKTYLKSWFALDFLTRYPEQDENFSQNCPLL